MHHLTLIPLPIANIKKRIKLALILGVVLFIVLIIIDYFQYNELTFW